MTRYEVVKSVQYRWRAALLCAICLLFAGLKQHKGTEESCNNKYRSETTCCKVIITNV